MEIKLIPQENFDEKSKKTVYKLSRLAENILKKLKIEVPKKLEFYDEPSLFYKKILPQVINYGLTKKQAINFIKASLNSGTYGTFNIKENSIIEMNFNPHFKKFYPARQFLEFIIHESLHLFLYSKLDRNIYPDKFKFRDGRYIGKERIIQLDEGFAGFLTERILENFDFDLIKELPIYSGLNNAPKYLNKVEGLDIKKFNEYFEEIYRINLDKGYRLIQNKFNKLGAGDLNRRIQKLILFIQEELSKGK